MRLYEFASDQVTVWFNPAYKGVDLDHNYWDKKPTKQRLILFKKNYTI